MANSDDNMDNRFFAKQDIWVGAMNCCPKCKGTTGCMYKMKVEYMQECDWEGKPTCAEQTGLGWDARIAECLDCGKMIRMKTIEGGSQ